MKKLINISTAFILMVFILFALLFIVSCDNSSKNGSSLKEDSLSNNKNIITDNSRGEKFLGTWGLSRKGTFYQMTIARNGDLFVANSTRYDGQTTTYTFSNGTLVGDAITGNITYGVENDHIFLQFSEWARVK